MKRCINCKQDILDFGAGGLGEFLPDLPPKSLAAATELAIYDRAYGDLRGAAYPFVREGEEGCFWHLRLQRGFVKGQILLRVAEVFAGYLRHSYDIAQCTHRILNNGYYSRLMTVPAKARLTSPWFIVENDRASLLSGLEQVGEWYRQSEEALFAACRQQQRWVDKEQGHAHRLARLFLREKWPEADQGAVWALYRRVDQLAQDYEAARTRGDFRYGDEHTFFSDWCSGKLPPPFDSWEEELSAAFLVKKNRITNDTAYAHSFAVGNLLYFIHDLAKDRWPNILLAERWKTEETGE